MTGNGAAGPAAPAALGPGNDERELVQVMVHRPDLRRGILDRLPDHALLREPELTLMELVGRCPEDRPIGELFAELDDVRRGLLTQVLARPWNPETAGAVQEGALRKLENRRIDRDIRDLRREMTVSPEDRKVELTGRIKTLKVEKLRGRSSAR